MFSSKHTKTHTHTHTHKAGETKEALEPHSDTPEMLDVSDQKFKTAVINILRTLGWKKYVLLCADLKTDSQ